MKHIKTYSIILLGILLAILIAPWMIIARIVVSVSQVLYYTAIDTTKYAKDLASYAKQEGSK